MNEDFSGRQRGPLREDGDRRGGHGGASTPVDPRSGDALMDRFRGEFTEMPGLRLTASQAARLFGIDEQVCETTLRALVDAGHLVRHVDGRFSRSSVV
ncbi:MAG: hypothetical protein AB1635_05320 [Acidobacteriota bacterium]